MHAAETLEDYPDGDGVMRPESGAEGDFGPSVSQLGGMPRNESGNSFINNQQHLASLPSNFSIGRPESEAGSIMQEPSRRQSVRKIKHTFSEATLDIPQDDDDALSVAASDLTVTRTINKVEDYSKEKPPEVGTVLEEETPKPVQLIVEFLGGKGTTDSATREFVDQLYHAPLELSIECQYLPKIDVFSNSDPFCVLYTRDSKNSPWKELGTTEKLTNCHFPRFIKKFILSANPDLDMEKEVLVKVYGKGSLKKAIPLGHAMCSLWEIIVSPGQCKVMKMDSINPNKDTWIILSADAQRKAGAERPVTINVKFDKSAKPRNKTFFMLNRSLKKARWTPIYRSEGHSNANREFTPAKVSFADLFCGDEKKPMRLEFFQKRSGIDPKLVGFIQTSIKQIAAMEEGRVLPWWSGQDGIAPGVVVLAKKEITEAEIIIWFAVTND